MSKKDIETVSSVSEDEFKNYVGIEGYKFLEARKKIIDGKYISWAWPPLFLGGIWAGYRKHWYGVFASCLCTIIFGVLGLLISHLMLAFFGKRQYVIAVSNKIKNIKGHETDPQRIQNISSAKGGTSILSAFFAAMLIVSSLGISFILLSLIQNG